MHNLRLKRRKNYKDLNNGSSKIQQLKSTAPLDDSSNASTLVGDSYEVPDFLRSPEVEGQEQHSIHEIDGSSEDEEFINGEVANNNFDVGACTRSTDGNQKDECIEELDNLASLRSESASMKVQQTVNTVGTATPRLMSQRVDIPSSEKLSSIVRQEISGSHIGQARPVDISQVASFPIKELTFHDRTRKSAHDTNIQPEQFHHHSGSSDSDELVNSASGSPDHKVSLNLNGERPCIDDYAVINSTTSKPHRFTKRFLEFLSLNDFNLQLLNIFIDGFIPLSFVEARSFQSFIHSFGTRQKKRISSRGGLVSLLRRFEIEFNLQLKRNLQSTSNLNLLIDMWTSISQKSYMAIMVSFCPNVNQKREILEEDVTTPGRPSAHILGFLDLGFLDLDGEKHTTQNIKASLLACLRSYSISTKIGSITLSNGTSNISILEGLEEDLQQQREVPAYGGIVKVRCMNQVLNLLLQDLMRLFERQHADLFSRIDRLTHILKTNVYIRGRISSYIALIIPQHNSTSFLSRHRQLDAFLKVSKGVKNFFFQNRYDHDCHLLPEDLSIFCYEQKDVELILFFVRLTNIFKDLTMMLQDDEANSLSNGIDYYMLIDSYFESCEKLRKGSADSECLEDVGLKQSHLSLSKDIKEQALSAVLSARPLFDKYKAIAYEEPGYWVAHILQPNVKTIALDSKFDEVDQDRYRRMAGRHVDWYISAVRHGASVETSVNAKHIKSKKYKLQKHLENVRLQQLAEYSISVKDEWENYLREPIEPSIGFLEYWLKNQSRFPALCSLALSFYYTKLSTADVERCFSVSERVLDNRFSLASANLRRTMILRNRIKCFNPNTKLSVVKDIPLEDWIHEDEESELRGARAEAAIGGMEPQCENIVSQFLSDSSDSD
ncbi:putative transposase of the Rover1 hAT-like family [Lachancea sp. 'fantastica']|nr:putative transposase of the Rover1 hAT-like family [Lachancea sp. 'fantastica']